MIPAAAISGGASLIGGLIQQIGQGNSIQQQENFQTQMSDSAYQRATVDMTKAGLNPAMMYGSGGAESTPSGASMTPPNVLGDAANSALQGYQASKAAQVSDSQIAVNLANAAKTTAGIPVEQAEGQFAKTFQSVANGLESFIQGWAASHARPADVSNLFQSFQSKANANNGPSFADDFEAGLNPFSPSFMSTKWKGNQTLGPAN